MEELKVKQKLFISSKLEKVFKEVEEFKKTHHVVSVNDKNPNVVIVDYMGESVEVAVVYKPEQVEEIRMKL